MIETIHFSTIGVPASGLSPSWYSLNKLSDSSAYSPQPTFTEVASSGWYKFEYNGSDNLVGVVDGGSSLSATDRYKSLKLNVSTEGDRQVTITVVDINTALVIPDTFITIKNENQTLTLNTGTTDVSGNYTPILNTGSYKVLPRKSFVNFIPETITVASTTNTFTIYGSGFSPTTLAGSGTCTVYGNVIDMGIRPVKNAKITAYEPINSRYVGSNKVIKQSTATMSDSNGYWEIELAWSSLFAPSGLKYKIVITYPSVEYSTYITVPNSNSAEFHTLI